MANSSVLLGINHILQLFCNFQIIFFPGGELYSGTVADFSGSDALIIKDQLRTEQYDFKHLNGMDTENQICGFV